MLTIFLMVQSAFMLQNTTLSCIEFIDFTYFGWLNSERNDGPVMVIHQQCALSDAVLTKATWQPPFGRSVLNSILEFSARPLRYWLPSANKRASALRADRPKHEWGIPEQVHIGGAPVPWAQNDLAM